MWKRAAALGAVLLLLLAGCSRRAGEGAVRPHGLFAGAVSNAEQTESYIALFDAAAGQLRRVSSSNRDWSPEMVPGKDRLYFLHEEPDGSVQVREVKLDGTGERTLVSRAEGWHHMVLSDSGTYAFLGDRKGLWLLDLQSGMIQTIAEAGVVAAEFGPGSMTLLYISNQQGREGLYRVDLPGTESVLVRPGLSEPVPMVWLGPTRIALDAGASKGLVLGLDGVEAGTLNGTPIVASPKGDWVATAAGPAALVFGSAQLDRPMMSLTMAFPVTSSPGGRYLLYSIQGFGQQPNLYMWSPQSTTDLAGVELVRFTDRYEVLGWSGEDAVILLSGKKTYWIDLTGPVVTEMPAVPAGFSARGFRPLPTPDLANLRTQRFAAWEEQAIRTVERAMANPDSLRFSPDAIRRDLAVGGLQIVDLPQERMRVWQMGPYPDPAGKGERPARAWLQWWEEGQAPRHTMLVDNLYTGFRVGRQGDSRVLIGIGQTLEDRGKAFVSAWRLEPGKDPQLSVSVLGELPRLTKDLIIFRNRTGITISGQQRLYFSSQNRFVRFADDRSPDLLLCDPQWACSPLHWGDKGYTVPEGW